MRKCIIHQTGCLFYDIKRNISLMWDDQRTQFEESYKCNIKELLISFSNEILFYHPIKLSK